MGIVANADRYSGGLVGLVVGYAAGVVEVETTVLSVLLGAIMIGFGWLGLRCSNSASLT